MKNLIIIPIAFLMTLLTSAQDTSKGVDITVEINNITNNDGKVILALHTAETFMKGPGVQNLSATIKDGKIKAVFTNVAEGEYAVLALHDANDNNRMDFEPNGMPMESYGVSNNDMSFGPPQFSSAKFEVKKEALNFNIRF